MIPNYMLLLKFYPKELVSYYTDILLVSVKLVIKIPELEEYSIKTFDPILRVSLDYCYLIF
jgi:hypothetical protein